LFKLNLYNQEGKVIGKVDLDPAIFSVKPNLQLVHQAQVAQLSNQRISTAHTKTRRERRGGGVKPWRQKGTGRARAGSIRSPLFRKGGIIFGPRKNHNFSKILPRKIKRKAICIVLSDRVKEEQLKVVDKIVIKDFKTQQAEKILNNLDLNKQTLVIMDQAKLPEQKSFANLVEAKLINVTNLNLIDLLNYPALLITQDALKQITRFCKH
jgi:large subunit ribosomal protein L4